MKKRDFDVSRGGGSGDVMVEEKQFGGLGDLGAVVPEMLSGLQDIGAEEIIPPAVGGLGAMLGTMAASKWGYKISEVIPRHAPLFGILGGVLASVPLHWAYGSKAVASGIVSSVVVGGSMWAFPRLETRLMGAFVRPMGMIEARPLAALPPMVRDSGAMPQQVRHQVDIASWGQVP
jgi:hypothetical protein